MPHESTYFPTFPNCFKRLNCFSMVMMVYFSFHLLVVLFPILGSESLAFDGWYFHTIHVKKKKENNVIHLKLSVQHSQMQTPQVQKEEVKSYIQGRSSLHHTVKLFQSYIFSHSENRTVIRRFTTYLVNRFCHGLYDIWLVYKTYWQILNVTG